MGQTEGALSHPFALVERSAQPCEDRDGCLSEDGNLMGTYIHGLFHNDPLRRAILIELASRRGRALSSLAPEFFVDRQYDQLAGRVKDSLDMGLIYRLLERP